jgi:uridylate kinase
MVTIISLGGSIVAPEWVDAGFVKEFRAALIGYLNAQSDRTVVLIVGGGAPARRYQQALREISGDGDRDAQDWVGIAATHLNGTFMKMVFGDECLDPIVTDPTKAERITGRVLVGAGWKPGFSTDFDAVILAERFGAESVVNLSNIAKIYTADPKTDPNAEPVDSLTWGEYRKMVGDEWTPGKNAPFDPVAAGRAQEAHLRVVTAAGRDIPNTLAILEGREFEGSVIGPH